MFKWIEGCNRHQSGRIYPYKDVLLNLIFGKLCKVILNLDRNVYFLKFKTFAHIMVKLFV